MKKTIIFILTFVSMLMNVNAQTCNVGLEHITVITGNVSAQSWQSPSINQICGTQRIVPSGNITAVGFIAGDATMMRVGIYSDEVNQPKNLLWTSDGVFPAPNHLNPTPPTGDAVDTFYVYLTSPIPVTSGEKFWPFMHFAATANYNLLRNNDADSGFLKFQKGSTFLNNLAGDNPISTSTTTGQWSVFLVIEDCVEPVCTNANTFVTDQVGNANDPETWDKGAIPGLGDCVVIQHNINWNISSPHVYESFTVNTAFSMDSASSIKTKSLVENVGQNFTGTVEITAEHANVSGTGSASKFEKLIVTADTLSFSKASEVFYLELVSDIVVQSTNLLMKGKTDIPSNIYWDATDNVSFSGPVTIDESFTIFDTPVSGNGSWRIQGSPGTGLTILDWSNNSLNPGHHTCGYPGSDYPSYNFKSPGFYDETVDDVDVDAGWIFPPTGNNTPLDEGFLAYYNGTLSGTNYTTRLSPVILTNDVTFDDLTYTNSANPAANGWHLLKNPFPCSVDIDEFVFVNVEEVVYTWDHYIQNNTTWNVGSGFGNSRSNELAAGQGFWIKVVAGQTGEVTIPVSAMIQTTNLEYRSGDIVPPIELVLTSQNEKSFNALVIPWSDEDLAYTPIDAVCKDASSSNGNVSIYTLSSDGVKLSQNVVPTNQSIILDVAGSSPTPNGQNTLTVNVNPFYQNWCLAIDWLGDDNEEWIPVTSGEVLVIPTNLQQHSQVIFAKLMLNQPASLLLDSPSDGTVVWEPFQTEASATITALGYYSEIEWDLGNGTIIHDENEITVFFYENSEFVPYNITVTATGCGTVTETYVVQAECSEVFVDIEGPDFIEINLQEGETIPEITFTINVFGNENTYWEFGYGPDANGNLSDTMTHQFLSPGSFDVTVSVWNDCDTVSDQVTVVINQTVSVSESDGDLLLSIYPIPNDGNMVSIVTGGYGNEPLHVDIINSIGAIIQREVLVGGSSNGSKRLYFNQVLSSGVYFVKVYNSQKTSTKQLVVE